MERSYGGDSSKAQGGWNDKENNSNGDEHIDCAGEVCVERMQEAQAEMILRVNPSQLAMVAHFYFYNW